MRACEAVSVSATGAIFPAGSTGRLLGITLVAGAGAAASALVYEGSGAAATTLKASAVVAAGGQGEWRAPDAGTPDGGVAYRAGLYLSLTGAGATVIVYYRT